VLTAWNRFGMIKPRIYVRPYRHDPKYRFILDLRAFGKGRRFFKTRVEAEAEEYRQKALLESHSRAAIGLSQREMSNIIHAKDRLAEYGETIDDAVQFRIDHLERVMRHGVTVEQLSREVIETRRKDGRSPTYINDLRVKLNRFCKDFGSRTVTSINAQELDTWLRELFYAPKSRMDYRANISVLFGFAEQRGIIDRNPVTRTAKPKLVDAPPEIFTVDELRSLLEAAKRVAPDVLPMLAIGAFAGIREAEIKRLDWSEVDLARGHIVIAAAKAKTARRRIVPIQPALAGWLALCPAREGRVVPPGAREKLDRVRAEAGLSKWPRNGLRHSFASYRLAAIHDAPRVATELGHSSPQILYSTYRKVVLPSEAERYWKVRPVQKIVPINYGDLRRDLRRKVKQLGF
jgi:integrase